MAKKKRGHRLVWTGWGIYPKGVRRPTGWLNKPVTKNKPIKAKR